MTTVKNDASSKENIFYLEDVTRINNQSQKLYIEKDSVDYTTIFDNILENSEFWEVEKVGRIDISSSKRYASGNSFLSIIKKENDELVNSNLLAYFLENDAKFWCDFVVKVLNISDKKLISIKPKITRESFYNIDLFIETNKYIFVIENKIKSRINSKGRKGYSQLEKYFDKATEYSKKNNKEIYFYLLRPDYNNENYKEFNKANVYEEIKY